MVALANAVDRSNNELSDDATICSVAICGSFGFGNVGDEAIPFALSDIASSLGLSLQAKIFSRYDANDPAIFGPNSWQNCEIDHPASTLIVAGGGAVEPNPGSVIERCAKIIFDRRWGNIIFFAGSCESGKRYGPRTRWRAWRILSMFDRVTTRDVDSSLQLSKLALRGKINSIGDAVLWLSPSKSLPEIDLPSKGYIAISFCRAWMEELGWLEWIAEQLVQVSNYEKLPLVFVPCATATGDDDRLVHRQICDIIDNRVELPTVQIDRLLSPREYTATISKASAVIGMRLHSCIIAYAQRVAFIPLPYHTKVIGFLRTIGRDTIGLPPFGFINKLNGSALIPFAQFKQECWDLRHVVKERRVNATFDSLDSLKESTRRELAACLSLCRTHKSK
jgi:polysaccharide pyruvyl transferase WcaK-like protein